MNTAPDDDDDGRPVETYLKDQESRFVLKDFNTASVFLNLKINEKGTWVAKSLPSREVATLSLAG